MIPVEVMKLIIANKEANVKNEEIIRILKVSVSAICYINTKYKQRGTLEGNYPGWQPKITPEQKQAMLEFVAPQPDITIEEIIETLKLPIKKSRVSKILIDNKIFFKKEDNTRKRTKA